MKLLKENFSRVLLDWTRKLSSDCIADFMQVVWIVFDANNTIACTILFDAHYRISYAACLPFGRSVLNKITTRSQYVSRFNERNGACLVNMRENTGSIMNKLHLMQAIIIFIILC